MSGPDSGRAAAGAEPLQARILGVAVLALEPPELERRILAAVAGRRRTLLLNVNAHALNLAYERPWLREFFNQAGAVFPDGFGAVLAARALGTPFRHRVTYADWFWQLADFCQGHGLSLFLLGARPGVADQARQALTARYPALKVVGVHHGYFDKRPGSAENEAVLAAIRAARPDILVVGFGMPLQEQWLKDNWARLEAWVGLSGGGVFDYVSGRVPRPPRLLTDRGLEWLGRLIHEPRRLWRRYLIGNPLFLWRVFKQRIGRLPAGIQSRSR